MKKTLLFLIACCTIFSANAQNPNPSAYLDSLILSEMSTQVFPGASTLIVKNGAIVWVESYGLADIADSVPVEDTTVFQVASVSKLFTATAAMQLYEAGITDLDADINNYLPWAVEIPGFVNDSITIRQLMTHSSSIDDYLPTIITYYGYPDPTISLADCMGRYFPTSGSDYNATNNFLNNAPGTSDNYSNMATALNGYIVEVASGVPFDDYCDSNIFEPLCMKKTAWHFSDFNSNEIAKPYRYQNGNYNYIHYGTASYPDRQLRTNVLDLGNFMIAYLNGGSFGNDTILTSATVNEMLTEQPPFLYPPGQGLNWYRTELTHSGGQDTLWGHNGSIYGIRSYLFIDTANDIGLCVLTNGEGQGEEICNALYDYALNMTVNDSIVPDCLATIAVNEIDFQQKEIIIYPNPAKDFIRVEMDLSKSTEFEIYATTGKLVLSGLISPANGIIDLSGLSNGLYLLKIENNFVKLVKTN